MKFYAFFLLLLPFLLPLKISAQEELQDPQKKAPDKAPPKKTEDPSKKTDDPSKKEAPSSPIEMNVQIGLDDQRKRSFNAKSWTTVTIELTNHRPKDFEGKVRLRIQQRIRPDSSGGEQKLYYENYEMALSLSKKADTLSDSPKKRFSLPIFLSESGIVEVKLYENEVMIQEEFYDILTYSERFQNHYFFLSLSGKTFRKPVSFFNELFPQKGIIDIHYLDPQTTVIRPFSLESYDFILLESLAHYDLGKAFYQELLRYVQSGGNLWIGTGEQWKEVQKNLEGTFFHSQLEPMGSLYYLSKKGKLPLVSIKPSEEAKIHFIPESEVVAFVEEKRGLGKVYVGATQLSTLVHFLEETNFLNALDRKGEQDPFHNGFREDSQLQLRKSLKTHLNQSLMDSYKIKLPDKSLIFLYLLSYFLCLVPLNYMIFRFFNKLEYSWISICFVAIFFFIGITTYQNKIKFDRFVCINFAMTEWVNSGNFGRKTSFFTGYSPDKASYSFRFGTEEPYYPIPLQSNSVQESRLAQENQELTKIWNSQNFTIPRISFEAKSTQSLEMRSYPEYSEPFEAQIHSTETNKGSISQKFYGKIKTPVPCQKAFLLVKKLGRSNFKYAELPQGSSKNSFSFNLTERDFKSTLGPLPFLEEYQKTFLDRMLVHLSETDRKYYFLGIPEIEPFPLQVDQHRITSSLCNFYFSNLSSQLVNESLYKATHVSLSDKEGRLNAGGEISIEDIRFSPPINAFRTYHFEIEVTYQPLKSLSETEPLILELKIACNPDVQKIKVLLSLWDFKEKKWRPEPVFQINGLGKSETYPLDLEDLRPYLDEKKRFKLLYEISNFPNLGGGHSPKEPILEFKTIVK
jgi:hypothetical protein